MTSWADSAKQKRSEERMQARLLAMGGAITAPTRHDEKLAGVTEQGQVVVVKIHIALCQIMDLVGMPGPTRVEGDLIATLESCAGALEQLRRACLAAQGDS